MGREIKRVPLDLVLPFDVTWPGFLEKERREPPSGEGWQVWETVSEGSPVTPVFPTAESLARQLKTADAQVAEILAKKSLTKDDKEQIRKIVHRVNRLMNDNAPFAMKLMGEHTEKLIAKGKAELDAIITMALRQAGIKAIEANGGVLSLPSPENDE